MGQMILELLCSLNVKDFEDKSRYDVQVFFIETLRVTKLVSGALDLQSHIPTNSTHFRVVFHMFIKSVQCLSLRSQTDVEQNSVFGSKLFAETIEKPVMRGQLPSVLVFSAHKQIHFTGLCLLRINLVLNIVILLFAIIFRSPHYEHLSSEIINQSQLLSRTNVLIAVL